MYLGLGGIILHRCGVQTYSRRRKAGSLNLKLKQKSAAGGVVCLLPLLLVRRWIRSAGRQTDRQGVEISAAWKPAV